MKVRGRLRYVIIHCTIEHRGHKSIIAQGFIRSLCTTHQVHKSRAILKFQSNRSERGTSHPTSAHLVVLNVAHTATNRTAANLSLHILADDVPNMRRNLYERKSLTRMMELEKPANNYTNCVFIPKKARSTIIRTAIIHFSITCG